MTSSVRRSWVAEFGMTCVAPVTLGSDTALVVIDMQYLDAARGRGVCLAAERMESRSTDYYLNRLERTVVPSIARLIGVFREREMQVIYLCIGSDYQDLRDVPPRVRQWIRNLEGASGVTDIFWSRNPDYEIRSELAPEPGDTVVQKRTFGAFNSSTLEEVLRGLGIRNLVIAGCATSVCVETTARDAADRGYGTVLVDECCADRDQEAHDATMLAIQCSFGRIARTVDDVVTAIDARQSL